ncbi:MAG: hypothetical protein IJ433_05345 [Ruminococcus sp.]|nr:hypothetical protein [Ruminococcus sp.]
MKIKLLASVLIISVILSGCGLFTKKGSDMEWLYARDADIYIYCDEVMINMFELHDTLEIDVNPDDEEEDWRWLVQGFIKRFAYSDDGILIMEFYDKWYTFDVKNYDSKNKSFDLKEYSSAELEAVYPDLESYEWKVGRYERNDENIKKNQWHNGFKTTLPYYEDTVPEFTTISESGNEY